MEFQSHLRLIHPIHFVPENIDVSVYRGFNRICASSTLSTLFEQFLASAGYLFQSHLRLIHPIHVLLCLQSQRSLHVSIASAPHPPYPLLVIASCNASPQQFQSHLRLIHPIHTFAVDDHASYTRFQSHLRLIHPIHCADVVISILISLSYTRFQSHLRLIHPIHHHSRNRKAL